MARLAAAGAMITASAWTERPRAFQNPSQDPHRGGHKEAAKGKQLFSKGRSQGELLMLGSSEQHVLGQLLCQERHRAMRDSSKCSVGSRERKKAGDRAWTPVEVERCFGGPHHFFTCCYSL